MADPTILVKKNPLTDLSPKQRLAEVQTILKVESREDWRKLIPRYLGDRREVGRGKVVVKESGHAPAVVSWRNSVTQPGRSDGTLRSLSHRAPADLWAEMRKAPKRRDPLVRVESMIKRYLAEVKQGNAAGIDRLGKQVVGEYWKAGMALTEEGLRTLAAASLQEAEMRQKRMFYKRSTSPWAVK